MNVRQMKLFARSLVRDQQIIDAHFLRWVNVAYIDLARLIIVPRLQNGNQVALIPVSGSTQNFYAPYDFARTIAFCDGNGRSLDILNSDDVRQFGEYNSFGSFVQFYEHTSSNITPVYDSANDNITIDIANRSNTATARAACFTVDHVGEWLLPTDRNTTSGSANPEDYAYRISAFVSSTVVTLERPFRGVLSDAGDVGDLTTAYFEIRPRNTPIIRIWGDPGTSSGITINLEYQRMPSKLANNEDIPEDPRLSEAIVYTAINLAGWAYANAFMVKNASDAITKTLSGYQNSKDFDKTLIRNYLTSNPMNRSYSQGLGGQHMGSGGLYSSSGIRY